MYLESINIYQIDIDFKVIVLQEYRNDSNQAIEAKYVFPLDDMAVVCGFEAFINGKHIVGEYKRVLGIYSMKCPLCECKVFK